ncbi:MAG TPA: lysozyme inhibitor LprI family protein [Coleofasciculaceae cyanobacterium]|jgi:uncharacterized protein YecT (DUF1311 family)
MKAFLVIALSATIALWFSANAQEALEGKVTHTHMFKVAMDHHDESVDKMNMAYDRLAKLLDRDGKQKLQTSQVAWKKFSEAECDFATDYSRDDKLQPLLYRDCLIGMTEDRTSHLLNELRWNYTLDPSISMKH